MGTISLNFYLRETYAWFNKKHYFWGARLALETNNYAFFFKFSHRRGGGGVEIPSLQPLPIVLPTSLTYTMKIKAMRWVNRLDRWFGFIQGKQPVNWLYHSFSSNCFGIEKSPPGLFQSCICLCMLWVNFYLSN